MKRFLMLLACGVIALSVSVASASTEGGDRILGVYKAVKDGAVSKVRISKIGDNAYKAQLFWLEKDKNPDGSLRTDLKNPDPAKRKTSANQIVLIQSVSYDSKEGVWKDGNIYDPTSGKVYKTVVDFTDEKTLRIRGYLGPFSKSLYWHKIEE
jgi:uncharacterized protein (DUF2147 family)